MRIFRPLTTAEKYDLQSNLTIVATECTHGGKLRCYLDATHYVIFDDPHFGPLVEEWLAKDEYESMVIARHLASDVRNDDYIYRERGLEPGAFFLVCFFIFAISVIVGAVLLK